MWTTWPPLQGVMVKQGPVLLFCLLIVIVVIVIVFAIHIVVVSVLTMIIILLSVVQGETIKQVCLLGYCIRNCLHRSV